MSSVGGRKLYELGEKFGRFDPSEIGVMQSELRPDTLMCPRELGYPLDVQVSACELFVNTPNLTISGGAFRGIANLTKFQA
jgi:hypothetical protein